MSIEKQQIGDCTLYCADASDVIATLDKVNCLVTDPPYGIDGSNGTIGKKRAKGAYTGIFEDTPHYIQHTVVPIIEACLEISDRGAVTTGGTCAGFYPNPSAIGAYVSPASAGLCKWGACTVQPIFFYGRDPRIGKDITPISRSLNEPAPKVDHPCPKPQKAWDWLVHKASLDGHTVLDPFMGSGTTGISCANLGRRFIGIELDPKYFDLACKRIEQAYQQPDFFVERTKKIKMERLF